MRLPVAGLKSHLRYLSAVRLPVVQMVVLDPKARWNTGGGFIPLCGKGSFSQCQLLE